MYIYTNKKQEIIAVSKKDIISDYANKYEVPDDTQIPMYLHLYTFDGVNFKLKQSAINELKQQIINNLIYLEKQRVNEVVNKYQYLSFEDVRFYASQNDAEADGILKWYSKYDDLIWRWINIKLSTYSDINTLQSIDVKAVEKDLFKKSTMTSPLP